MKTRNFLHLSSLCVALISLIFAQRVSAHGGEPRLEISAERLNPGSLLEVRGVDFEFEEDVALALVGDHYEIPLSPVTADTEGIFLVTITLPADLAEGTYVIRATTDDHALESSQLTISGTASLGGGEESEQEEGLLAPMPTFAANDPTPIPQSAAPVETAPQENARMPVVWIAAGIGIVVLLGLVLRRRTSSSSFLR
jgi:hypothetical protein